MFSQQESERERGVAMVRAPHRASSTPSPKSPMPHALHVNCWCQIYLCYTNSSTRIPSCPSCLEIRHTFDDAAVTESLRTCVEPSARIEATEGTVVNARQRSPTASTAAKNRQARIMAGWEHNTNYLLRAAVCSAMRVRRAELSEFLHDDMTIMSP